MSWFDILKIEAKPYTYGRCQHSNGTGCIRPLQSPERRKDAGSKPNGKTCMYCEDDASKWSIVPEEIWSDPKYYSHRESDEQKSRILDRFVKRHPNAWRKLHEEASEHY